MNMIRLAMISLMKSFQGCGITSESTGKGRSIDSTQYWQYWSLGSPDATANSNLVWNNSLNHPECLIESLQAYMMGNNQWWVIGWSFFIVQISHETVLIKACDCSGSGFQDAGGGSAFKTSSKRDRQVMKWALSTGFWKRFVSNSCSTSSLAGPLLQGLCKGNPIEIL